MSDPAKVTELDVDMLLDALTMFSMAQKNVGEIYLENEAFYTIKSRVLERAVSNQGGFYGRFGPDVSLNSFKLAGITVRRIEKRGVDKP